MAPANAGQSAPASTSAKILYKPVAIVTSMIAGLIATALFKQVWKRASPNSEGDAPSATQSEFGLGEILLAAVIQGAIFAGVRALVERQGARAFAKATGEWPGS